MTQIHAGDLDIAYTERGEGTPIVFIHGNWATKNWWLPVLERLPAGWRGIAYDMRGRGATTGPDSSYQISALAADLAALAEALELGPLVLVGHSLGSAVAMQFALEYPQHTARLVALSPAWVDGMPAAYHNAAAQQALAADRALFGQAIRAMAPTAPDDAFWQSLVDESHQQRVAASLANLDALRDWQPGDTLAAIAAPKRVVSGANDLLTGGANAERAAQALRAPHVIIPGVGHSPNLEAPDALLDAIGLTRQGNE